MISTFRDIWHFSQCLKNPLDGRAWWAAQPMGSLRVRHYWATSHSLFTFMHWRRKWQPTPVFLPGESQRRGSLVGCHLWGCAESDTTEAIWQQQQQHFSNSNCKSKIKSNESGHIEYLFTEGDKMSSMWLDSEPGRLQSMGSLSWTRLSDFTFTFHFHALQKEMATHTSVLAWRIPGMGKPGELPSMGSHRVRHDWHDLAAARADIFHNY